MQPMVAQASDFAGKNFPPVTSHLGFSVTKAFWVYLARHAAQLAALVRRIWH